MKYILMFPLIAISIIGYSQVKTNSKKQFSCDASCTDNYGKKILACKLTSPDLQERKATVISSLKKQVVEKKQVINGYSNKFKGSDSILDELNEFVKTERQCCDFFDFTIKTSNTDSFCWLT
ncbi:hypothetical protein, partial [Sphingobacterium sp. UBA7253]